ncbi:MAG: prepilin-type N-terminal cleavage/methylation domain-containing protein [Planctomycetes bacterium]|nr:prepilin-type N-terminal cleavage/methylation domain-containing protein [Planctomycetota bacterium]
MSLRHRRRGFTLVELLVVIGVIAVLAALAIPALSGVRRNSQRANTKNLITELGLAIENYQLDFGDYPPSTPKRAGLTSNGKNDGVEALVRCLTTQAKNGPYFEFKDDQLGNTDVDALPRGNPTQSTIAVAELFEVVDDWGNPLVYWNNADYDKPATCVKIDGATIVASAGKAGKTGQYADLTKFQLWSAGPDGEPGTDDDVSSWSSE